MAEINPAAITPAHYSAKDRPLLPRHHRRRTLDTFSTLARALQSAQTPGALPDAAASQPLQQI
jgi:hypothetical protein